MIIIFQRNTDWDSAAVLLKGVYETMIRCPYIMHWQQVKTVLNTVQVIFLFSFFITYYLKYCNSL